MVECFAVKLTGSTQDRKDEDRIGIYERRCPGFCVSANSRFKSCPARAELGTSELIRSSRRFPGFGQRGHADGGQKEDPADLLECHFPALKRL